MNAKHTPGPWNINEVAREYSGKLEITSPHGDNGTHVASVTVEKKSFTEEQAANAALIAAAPDLLAALVGIINDQRFISEFDKQPNIEAARAAIAKATGGQS